MANFVSSNQIQIQIGLVRPDTCDDTSQPWLLMTLFAPALCIFHFALSNIENNIENRPLYAYSTFQKKFARFFFGTDSTGALQLQLQGSPVVSPPWGLGDLQEGGSPMQIESRWNFYFSNVVPLSSCHSANEGGTSAVSGSPSTVYRTGLSSFWTRTLCYLLQGDTGWLKPPIDIDLKVVL